MPSECHYRGDQLENLLEMSKRGHVWGPDICGAPRPGEILGQGAYYELKSADYDEELDRTTAHFTPWIDPRTRTRFHGAAEGIDYDEPADVGTPKLAARDNIRRR